MIINLTLTVSCKKCDYEKETTVIGCPIDEGESAKEMVMNTVGCTCPEKTVT